MKDKVYKRKCLLLLVAIMIAAALTLAIYINGKDKSCDQCIIEFKTTRQFGLILQGPSIIEQNALELYNEFQKGECLITFDKNSGYRKK
ncbi:MAG: hypothetical protein ACOC5T_05375 [Elusimicrobiota bacterium]